MVFITKVSSASGCPACDNAQPHWEQAKAYYQAQEVNVFFDETIYPSLQQVPPGQAVPSYYVQINDDYPQEFVAMKTTNELKEIIDEYLAADNGEEPVTDYTPYIETGKDIGLTLVKGIAWGLGIFLFSKIVQKYEK